MAQQTINVGTAPNDGTGTPLRTAFQYTNSNFSELYTATGPSGNNITVPGTATITGDLTVDTSTLKVDSANNRVGIGTASPTAALDVFGAFGTSTAATVLRNNSAPNNSNIVETQYFASNNNSGLECIAKFGALNPAATGNNYGQFYWQIANAGSPTTAMTLNSTGLGVGGSPATKIFANVTPPSAGQDGMRVSDGTRLIQMSISGSTYSYQGIGANQNVIYASGNPLSILSDGQNLRLGTSSTSYLLLDTSGNVGLGVTPSAWGSAFKAAQLTYGGLYSQAFTVAGVAANCFNAGAGGWQYFGSGQTASRYEQSVGTHAWYTAAAGTGAIGTFTQAMTLDASGNLLVGKTVNNITTVGFQSTSTGEVSAALAASTNAATQWTTYSTGAAAYRFYVGMGGTVFATNTTISAISDARFKENVQDIDVGLGAILALKPRKFDWKEGKGKNIKGDRGFIAQEFETVFPNLIDEWKENAPEGEAPYKSVRQDLIPVLVKAIQELTARVQTLETR